MERDKLHCRQHNAHHAQQQQKGKQAVGWDRSFFFSPAWDDKSNFMLFKVKSYYLFQHEGISYIIYLFGNTYFGHLCMRPQQIWGTCIFSVLFKDQLEQGILNRITFNA